MTTAQSSMMIDMDTIGSRIRERRRELGLSQQQLGDRVKITKAAISAIESGKTKSPTPRTLFDISEALACSAEYLLNGDNEQHPADASVQDTADELYAVREFMQLRVEERRAIYEFIRKIKATRDAK